MLVDGVAFEPVRQVSWVLDLYSTLHGTPSILTSTFEPSSPKPLAVTGCPPVMYPASAETESILGTVFTL